VGQDEATTDMAVKAAQQALTVSGAHAGDIDLVIVATCTPDHIMPSTASLVQDRLGAVNAGALDLNAACSGFVYALALGASHIEARRARHVLVIGADELSIHLDWKDRSTCVLFGDGAGAVLLRGGKQPGILKATMGSDGSGANLLMIPAGGSRIRLNGEAPRNGDHYLKMNGPQIFRAATQMMAKASEKVIAASGLAPEQVDLFIPHQANMRIIESAARRLSLPPEKVFANVQNYGNTSAASIPIALCEAIAAGRVKVGNNLLLASFGAGLSWAAVALRWTQEVSRQPPPWSPIRQQLETRVAAVRSAIRRQERKVLATLDEKLRRDGE
jgi:3-oxoacyl-[acyl-carrier-protein] synthase-3